MFDDLVEILVFLTVDWFRVSNELVPRFSESLMVGVDLLVDDLSFRFWVKFLVVRETMVIKGGKIALRQRSFYGDVEKNRFIEYIFILRV